MKCDNDDCTMAVHICCLYTPGSQVAKDCEGDMSWFCDTCFRGPIPGLTGSSRLDAIVAVGGSRAKRKASVLESDDGSSLLGVGRHWLEQMAAGDNGKEPMDIDNTEMSQLHQLMTLDTSDNSVPKSQPKRRRKNSTPQRQHSDHDGNTADFRSIHGMGTRTTHTKPSHMPRPPKAAGSR